MQVKTYTRNPIVRGTLILTFAGALTRILGFAYRIYLTNIIGAKEVGIYQLVFPVYIFAICLSCQGFQAAITRLVSMYHAKGDTASMQRLLRHGILLTLPFSLLIAAILFLYAEPISVHIIKNAATKNCLRIIVPGLPFVAVKCVIHGYFLGLKDSKVTGIAQLTEQLARVLGTFFVTACIVTADNRTAVLAALGVLIGEVVSCLYSAFVMQRHLKKIGMYQRDSVNAEHMHNKTKESYTGVRMLLRDAVPLTANRVAQSLLSSLEAILIPSMLTIYYQNQDMALAEFGVLMGMAMPFILLPSTLTNALASMLLPSVTDSHTTNAKHRLSRITERSLQFCFLLGAASTVIFLVFGRQFGLLFFKSALAGTFMTELAFLCPCIHLCTTLNSILNGLDKVGLNLFYHLLSISIRICFVIFGIPKIGIQAYFLGLFVSYMTLTVLLYSSTRHIVPKRRKT